MSRPVAALALVLLGPALAAQAQAPLAWKWQKGEQFTLSVATAYEDQTTIAGKQLKSKAKTAFAFDVTVREAPEGGNVTLDLRITSVQAAGSTRSWTDAINKDGKAIKRGSFSLTLDREMKSQQFGGIGALAKKIIDQQEGDPALLVLTEKIWIALFHSLLQEVFVPMPGKATAKGDTWEQQMSGLDAPPWLGTLATTKTFTDQGKTSVDGKEVRKVGIKGVMKFVPPKVVGWNGSPFERFDLKKQAYQGTLYFDPAAGRPVSSDIRVVTEATMSQRVRGVPGVDGATIDREAMWEWTYQIRFGEKKKVAEK
jgi:hypothetical protein